MSADGDDTPGNREVAYRVFAAEYEDADFSYSESDEERAPNYVVTPTGARANRLFVVGVLTETEQVNDEVLRARIVDPTGAVVAYAGQYQPDELAFLERADPPTFVALTGKARTFQPDDSDTVYTSVRPESINEVDAATRNRWVVNTAEQTIDRVATMATALAREERGDELTAALRASGTSEPQAAGTALAIDHYGTTSTYLQAVREIALDAARVVSGDIEEVDDLTTAPDAEGTATLNDLTDIDTDGVTGGSTPETAAPAGATGDDTTTEPQSTDAEPSAESTADPSTTESTDSSTETTSTAGTPSTDEPTDTAVDATSDEVGTERTASAKAEDTGAPPDPAEPAGTENQKQPTESEPGTVDSEPAPGDTDTGTAESDDEEIGDFEPGEFDLDEDEREEIEEEYGTEFETGTEVDEPGTADIDTPDPEEIEAEAQQAEADAGTESATDAASESDPESEEPAATEETTSETPTADETVSDEGTDAEAGTADDAAAEETEATDAVDAEDVDLEEAVMETMDELNGDDGADRQAVVDSVADQYGADPDDVEDAIQDALMDGRCYEPDDTTLKPI